ncbi:LOW QUALITY PROTEIN: hypothetical protein MC885_008264 [Smutsia gigantea]|nr:LOW QUALITY PROTEIN: hypothetical protein MC885_008264 [Smutsia gigantea]
MSQWTPEYNKLYTLTVDMKSEIPSDVPKTQESLKGILLHPEPTGAAKSFPAGVEMINSKVGSEFSHLCDDSQKQEKDRNGNQQEQEKNVTVRKKRKSQQAGPSYVQNCVKGNQGLSGLRPHLETPSDEDNDSSFSDCLSSPSSSLHFGDSDTVTSDEDKEVSVRHRRGILNAKSGIHSARSQKWPRTETESVSGLLMKRPCFHGSSLRKLPCRKRFVKINASQRTQKQKERILMQRKKREVLARRKYALLPSSSSSSENELSSASSSSSSTEGEEDLFVSATENHQNNPAVPSESIDEDVVVIEASSTPQVTANEEINVTSTDSEVEIVTVGESYRSRSTLGHSRSHWSQGSGSHTGRPQEPRNRSRISTVIQPLRQNAAEVVDLTVDEDEPTAVPTTCSRMESQTTSTLINNSDSSAPERASDTAPAVTSSRPSTASAMSAPLTGNSMTSTSTSTGDDSRRTASSAVTETGPPAMPRLPSCCPQHSPCGGSAQNHHALGHPHTSCFPQHGHHFQHHHHHHHTPHPAVPVSPSFSDPPCPVERPPQVQPPCGANSSSGTSYHDQQALPVDLSNSGIRSHGGGGFHGASAFDPCCPVSSSRAAVFGHQAAAAPTVIDRRLWIGHGRAASAPAPATSHPLIMSTLYATSLCFFDKTTSSSSLCLPTRSRKPPSSDSASPSSGLCYSSSCTCFPFSNIFSCNISLRGTPTPNSLSQHSCTNPSASSSHTPANLTSYSSHCTSSTETSSSRSDAEDGSSKKEDDAASNAGT